MKTTKLLSLTKNILIGILTIVMIVSFTSCSKKLVFLKSSVTPAAEGYVTVKKDKNNNYVIQIKLSNLAGIERLQPPKKSYVIWMHTDQESTENLGRITSSNKLNATFETVTSYKPIIVFITAEEDADAQQPGNTIVLTTEKFLDQSTD